MKYLALLICLIAETRRVSSVGADLGTCSCMCGVGGSGGVLTPSGTSPASSRRSFLDSVRGQKGDRGRPGKSGPQGPPGMKGNRGSIGPPGPASGGSGDGGAQGVSCFDLRSKGITASGVYRIRPSTMSSPITVYCDMDSAGGGWTLVASIHENNIDGKCSIGDNWSSDQGLTPNNYTGTGNWENYNVFGDVEAATSADYKSTAYAALPASDIMVWHVPNNVDITQWSSQAFLKYYTDTRFLDDKGSSLQALFSKYTPLVKGSLSGTAFEGVVSILRALNASAANIRSTIPNFYNYNYDFSGTQNHISDGGGDMYDTGNRVYYQIGTAPPQQIVYRKTYRDLINGVEVSSSTEHPFIMLMWVGNHAGTVSSFKIKVVSGTGADGGGSHTSYQGDIAYQGFNAYYKAYSIYNANDPSICEVYFYVTNQESWNSVAPSSFTKPRWSSGTDNLDNQVQVNGNPRRFLMGYTLLSREDDFQVTESHVRSALTRMLQDISRFTNIENFNCSRLNESVVSPIRYLLGSDAEVMRRVPPSIRAQVQPGYVHFRAYSPTGIPNAFCPGVRSDACNPEVVCVGGINVYNTDRKSCGDYAGWAGKSNTRPTDEATGSAHSIQDINSSILIFTRKQASGAVVP